MIRARRLASIACVTAFLAVGSVSVPTEASGADLVSGKKIYVDKCLRCHGEKGKGDGPRAWDLVKKPADYTDKATMSRFTDADLKKAVKEGKRPMPAFGNKLSDQEISEVVAYIRTFIAK